ncbi:ABC transporter permease [Lysinibacillus sp. SGAir0095]|uniref:ABC transporter permease n=1 Tax=Lysinibacillus sp. SGAir0095 TaxID=2070463 RepID=UPI0010CD646D|nr:ABC transporter permease subunit [Lysinibacillus sp. SGAir0095]QCR33746.1 ABC transporter permease [Lysinibacillus sp. SGAir0095]
MITLLRRTIFVLILITIWEAISKFEVFPAFMWPPLIIPNDPGGVTVVKTLVNGIISGQLLEATGSSLIRLFIGFIVAVIIGFVLGFLIYKYKIVDDTLGFFVTSLQAIPNIVWMPLAILWFGLGVGSVIFIVILGAALSITITSSTAFKSVPPLLIRVASTMGSSGFHLFRTVIFKSTIPQQIAGLRLAWALAWRAVLAGELLGGSGGLGTLLDLGRSIQAMDLIFSIMIIIGIIGSFIDNFIFVRIERIVLRKWGIQTTH